MLANPAYIILQLSVRLRVRPYNEMLSFFKSFTPLYFRR